MRQADLFWKLDGLSDGAVLGGLQGLVGSGRRVLAALLAHLGEVEERRLHLAAGHGSMFVYCVSELCLSEDEAYRRIEVARLARRFPALFPLLGDGRISLSVVAMLKPHITPANMDELTQLVCGASVQRARELLAARFPRPDVPSTIRKLPEPRRQPLERLGGTLPGVLESAAPPTHSAQMAECAQSSSPGTEPCVPGRHHVAINDGPLSSSSTAAVVEAAPPAAPCSSPPRPASHRALVPLAEGRYKVQFTADAELKHKLELARDLMRHSLPGGDMATILARALDLLVERLMKRRFGVGAKRSQSRRRKGATQESAAQTFGDSAPSSPSNPSQTRRRKAATQESAAQPPADSSLPPPSGPSPNVTRATRRAVLERDGLRCSFQSEDGTQCNARAWLEDDHIQPRAHGGDGGATNIRILCRAHNLLAAERTFGRAHIERAICRRRAAAKRVASDPARRAGPVTPSSGGVPTD